MKTGKGGHITRDGGPSPLKFSDPGPGKCGDPPSTPMKVDGTAGMSDGGNRHDGIDRPSLRGTRPSRLDGMTAPAGPKGSIKKLGGSRDSGGFRFRH